MCFEQNSSTFEVHCSKSQPVRMSQYRLQFIEHPLDGLGKGQDFEEDLSHRVFWYRAPVQPGPMGWIPREGGHRAFKRGVKTTTLHAKVQLVDAKGKPVRQRLAQDEIHLAFSLANYDRVKQVDGSLRDAETTPNTPAGVSPPVVLSDKSEALSIKWVNGQYQPADVHFRVEESSRTKKKTNRPYFALRVQPQDSTLTIPPADSQPFICRSKKNKSPGSQAPAMVTAFGADPTYCQVEAQQAGLLGPETSRRKEVAHSASATPLSHQAQTPSGPSALRAEIRSMEQQLNSLRAQLTAMEFADREA